MVCQLYLNQGKKKKKHQSNEPHDASFKSQDSQSLSTRCETTLRLRFVLLGRPLDSEEIRAAIRSGLVCHAPGAPFLWVVGWQDSVLCQVFDVAAGLSKSIA